jgi:hypothetical protein
MPAYGHDSDRSISPRLLSREREWLDAPAGHRRKLGGRRTRAGTVARRIEALRMQRHPVAPRLRPPRGHRRRTVDLGRFRASDLSGADASIHGDARARGHDQSDSQRMALVARRGPGTHGERRCFCPIRAASPPAMWLPLGCLQHSGSWLALAAGASNSAMDWRRMPGALSAQSKARSRRRQMLVARGTLFRGRALASEPDALGDRPLIARRVGNNDLYRRGHPLVRPKGSAYRRARLGRDAQLEHDG